MNHWELVLCAAVLAAAASAFLVGLRRGHRKAWAAVLILGAGIAALAAGSRSSSDSEPAKGPALAGRRPLPDQGFVSSSACRSCHPDHYHSWHATYHRTMTQQATPEAVVPDWDGVTLQSRGRTYRLLREGDEFWVDMPDPMWELQRIGAPLSEREETQIPRVRQKIVMTTGSHHHQTYWVQNSKGMLIQFPWVYHIEDRNWVFRVDSFLMPPTDQVSWRVWNLRCIACHSTGGQPRVDPGNHTMFSHVGELGIACEACHGPGREHVAANSAPVRRYKLHLQGEPDPTIVNPLSCSPERASQICGQCHSFGRSKDMEAWLRHGDPYRAGDDLSETRMIDYYTEELPDEWKHDPLVQDPAYLRGRFWPDGTVRTGGREYNGLIESPCYQHGTGNRRLSCLSCHSMHESDPSDQLAAGMRGNQACIQCHDEKRFLANIEQHTHHPAGSSGSRCYNCHMPHTTYALFRGIRSHRIDSPSVANSVETGRPNACNLCHLDQTLQWSAEHLSEWHGHQSVPLDEDERTIAASVLWALRGDAVQRVITAWNMGRAEAHEASGRQWLPPILAQLLDDPYPAVRNVAWHALRNVPGFKDFEFEFDAPPDQRAEARQQASDRWTQSRSGTSDRSRSQVLLTPDGTLDQERFRRLLEQRDDSPIIITE